FLKIYYAHTLLQSEEFRPIRIGHAYSRDFEGIQNESLKKYLKERIKDVLAFFRTALMVPKNEDPLVVADLSHCDQARYGSHVEEKYNKDILIFIDVSMTHTCKPGSRTLAYASVCGINKSRED
ncbi:hypothetical protein M514_16687, partial [Trichuris suis]